MVLAKRRCELKEVNQGEQVSHPRRSGCSVPCKAFSAADRLENGPNQRPFLPESFGWTPRPFLQNRHLARCIRARLCVQFSYPILRQWRSPCTVLQWLSQPILSWVGRLGSGEPSWSPAKSQFAVAIVVAAAGLLVRKRR